LVLEVINMLRQPVSQVQLTNVAIVRLKKNGLRFEIACYPNKVSSWRDGVEKDVNEVLQSKDIFNNVQKGVYAKQTDIHKAFGKTADHLIMEEILKNGDVQVNELERKSHQESILKDVASIIAEKCVDAQSGCPVPYTIILRALEEIHVNVNVNKPAKKQALAIIKAHKDRLGLERAKMRLRLTYAQEVAPELQDLISQITIESLKEDANTVVIGLIHPESYRLIFECIKTKGIEAKATIEVLDQRVVAEGEGTIRVQEEVKAEPVLTPAQVRQSHKKGLSCNTCPGADFNDVNDHRNHFKTVWHKYNIKRKSRNVETIIEAEFNILSPKEVNDLLESKIV
jgi:ribosome maturation protein SDO1